MTPPNKKKTYAGGKLTEDDMPDWFNSTNWREKMEMVVAGELPENEAGFVAYECAAVVAQWIQQKRDERNTFDPGKISPKLEWAVACTFNAAFKPEFYSNREEFLPENPRELFRCAAAADKIDAGEFEPAIDEFEKLMELD